MQRRFRSPVTLLVADAGTPAGGPNDATPPTDDATGDNANGGSGAITFASQDEFQKRVEEMLRERLAREERKRERAAEEARRQAEERALKEQQRFKELADSQAKRLAELEPLVAQLEAEQATTERYKAALTKQLEALRTDLPKPILALLDRLDPVEQLEWLAANGAELAPKGGGAGIPPTPKPTGPLTDQQALEAEIAARRARGYR